jgi:hypothetical protein
MSRLPDDAGAHEKEIAPGSYARFPWAGRPELRQRLAELERRKGEAYLVAEEERQRRARREEGRALSRGRRRV